MERYGYRHGVSRQKSVLSAKKSTQKTMILHGRHALKEAGAMKTGLSQQL